MFTYVCLGTNDLRRAAVFYDAVLAVLGHRRCDVGAETGFEDMIGWGTYTDDGRQELALWICKPFDGASASVGNGTMLALKANSWRQVDEFHAFALVQGGASEGAPGLRPQYNDDFYAAYIRDLDGNKLAAVCRGFTAPQES
jgi:catechol 2,3-dioxygenase-like lactoylglutathione lyase family enzyme